jgi:mRNA interferase MazF
MIFDQWEVVLVPFPFMDTPVSKKRPALVLSAGAFNNANDHTVFAMITTAKASTWSSDYLLNDPEAAGLTKDCYVRWKTFTLPNEIIARGIGPLAPLDMEALERQVRSIFVPGF